MEPTERSAKEQNCAENHGPDEDTNRIAWREFATRTHENESHVERISYEVSGHDCGRDGRNRGHDHSCLLNVHLLPYSGTASIMPPKFIVRPTWSAINRKVHCRAAPRVPFTCWRWPGFV